MKRDLKYTIHSALCGSLLDSDLGKKNCKSDLGDNSVLLTMGWVLDDRNFSSMISGEVLEYG